MENICNSTDTNNITYGRGYVYSLQYHIVWCTKYRKKILLGQIEQDLKEYLKVTCNELEAHILAMEVMPDHIHLLLSCKPQFKPSDAIKILKGNTARWMFIAHPELKQSLYGGHLWNPSYFIATVSERNTSQIAEYIDTQKEK